MKKSFLLVLVSITLYCCNNSDHTSAVSQDTTHNNKTDSAHSDFFPVTSFLQFQLKAIDSMPVTILQVTTVNNHSDSIWLAKDKLKPLLQPFFTDSIDKKNLVGLFKESQFNDQSTEAITFTYSPIGELPEHIHLRRWDVYVNPETGTLKRVYIVKVIQENGEPVTQQLTWQANRWAKIVTIPQKDKSSSIKEVKWIWDLRE